MRVFSFYWLAHRLVLLWCTLLYRLKVCGREQVPKGAALLVSNHVSHLDPMLLGISCPSPIHFLARSTLWDSRLLGWMMNHLNAHPLDKGEGDLKAMRLCLELLSQGNKLVMFPEGTRSRDGELQEGQLGVAALALRADVPVTPAHIEGSYDVWKAGQSRPKWRGRIVVTFGKPLLPETYAHLKRREAQEKMTADLMRTIRDLRPR